MPSATSLLINALNNIPNINHMLFVPFWRKKAWVFFFFFSFSFVGLLSIAMYLRKGKKCQGTGTKGSCSAMPVHPWEFVLRPEEPLRSSAFCANSSSLLGFKLGQRSGPDFVSGSTKFPLILSFRFLCPSAGTLTWRTLVFLPNPPE